MIQCFANASKSLCCLTALLVTYPTQAQTWPLVESVEIEKTPLQAQLRELDLLCQSSILSFDKKVAFAACRDEKDSNAGLAVYTLKQTSNAYEKTQALNLGDASVVRQFEFHSPQTIQDHSEPAATGKQDERIILLDVADEGSCYATEVFSLKKSEFKHIGTILESTLKYTLHPDQNYYDISNECLGKYAFVKTNGNNHSLIFSPPGIYTTDANNGNLILSKRNVLEYVIPTSGKLRKKQ